jgi:hypothetical protein
MKPATAAVGAARRGFPTDTELEAALYHLLRDPALDWERTTKKTIRAAISQAFGGIDLSDKRDFLNGLVDTFVAPQLAGHAVNLLDAEDAVAAPVRVHTPHTHTHTHTAYNTHTQTCNIHTHTHTDTQHAR